MTTIASLELGELATGLLPEVVDLRRSIHRHPELGLELPRTREAVLHYLEPLGLDITLGSTSSSVVADLEGSDPGPTVLLRGDMDALPMPEDTGLDFASEVDGAMHACGHDAHVAMLAGAARLLSELHDSLPGRVRFMFQPGEEGFHGAREMIAEGVLDDVDAAFAIHVTPNVPSGFVASRAGPLLASDDILEIEVRGRGGHASTPHLGNDPIPVACEIVSALQTFVTRRVNVFDPAVVTIGSISSGTTTNVVPEAARMLGTMRTTSESTRRLVKEGVTRIAEGVAAAHEMSASVRMTDGYPVTANNAEFVDRVERVVGDTLGSGRFLRMPSPVMGAEDFSYVLNEVPGAMVFLGVCPADADPLGAASCHSNRMMLDESAMADGVALHAAVALDVLGSGI